MFDDISTITATKARKEAKNCSKRAAKIAISRYSRSSKLLTRKMRHV